MRLGRPLLPAGDGGRLAGDGILAGDLESGGVAAGFRGVGARVCEFGISYTVTGAMSVLVLRLWPG